jgi:hypothetical protein
MSWDRVCFRFHVYYKSFHRGWGRELDCTEDGDDTYFSERKIERETLHDVPAHARGIDGMLWLVHRWKRKSLGRFCLLLDLGVDEHTIQA